MRRVRGYYNKEVYELQKKIKKEIGSYTPIDKELIIFYKNMLGRTSEIKKTKYRGLKKQW